MAEVSCAALITKRAPAVVGRVHAQRVSHSHCESDGRVVDKQAVLGEGACRAHTHAAARARGREAANVSILLKSCTTCCSGAVHTCLLYTSPSPRD